MGYRDKLVVFLFLRDLGNLHREVKICYGEKSGTIALGVFIDHEVLGTVYLIGPCGAKRIGPQSLPRSKPALIQLDPSECQALPDAHDRGVIRAHPTRRPLVWFAAKLLRLLCKHCATGCLAL